VVGGVEVVEEKRGGVGGGGREVDWGRGGAEWKGESSREKEGGYGRET